MPWELVIHLSVEEWLGKLSLEEFQRVSIAFEKLREEGPALSRPFVDHVKGSSLSNLKELRPRGGHFRILFAFDLKRRALLVVGGDKSKHWKSWYRENIPLAELRFYELEQLLDGKGENHE